MKKFSKTIGLILIASILMGASITWERDSVTEGEIIEVEFPHDVENVEVPDGFEYLGYENGIHRFKALKDMENVKGHLFYEKNTGEDEKVEEDDKNNHHGEVGGGEGTEIEWGAFDLGKHSWELQDGSIQYAIRIDLDKYRDLDYIILEDIPSENLKLISEINVNRLNPNKDNVVVNDGLLQVEEEIKGNGFTLKIPVTGDKALDIVYYMKPTNDEDVSNRYKVYSIKQWEEEMSGGSIEGEDKPEEVESPKEEEKPKPEPEHKPIPEDKPSKPIPKPEEKPIPKPDTPKEPEVIVPEIPIKPIDPPTEDKEDEPIAEDKEEPEDEDVLEDEEEEPEDEEEVEVEDDEPEKEIEPEETEEEEVEDVEDETPPITEPKEDPVSTQNKTNNISKKLPKTGSWNDFVFYILGVVLILVGVMLNK